jgi:hypothetical protein
MKYVFAALSFLMIASPVLADQDEFCAGFEQGYKAVKGNMVLVPLCPLEPLTPLDSTPFQEGIKAGIEAANR